jgi:hypothetical protein
MTPAPTTLEPVEQLHGCVRCGARIPLDQAMCEACNPLGLKQPSPSQAHGTVFIGIALAVIVMAVVARMTVSGVGPFSSGVADVAQAPGGLLVSVVVRNEGSAAAAVTCRIGDPEIRGIGPETAYVSSPVIPPGGSVTFESVVTSLGTTVRPLTADCS